MGGKNLDYIILSRLRGKIDMAIHDINEKRAETWIKSAKDRSGLVFRVNKNGLKSSCKVTCGAPWSKALSANIIDEI